MEEYRISQRRACRLTLLSRSTCRYVSCRQSDVPERMRLKEIAMARPRYGYQRLLVLLQREGWQVNHKNVLRIYREENLLVQTRRRRKTAAQARMPLEPPSRVHER